MTAVIAAETPAKKEKRAGAGEEEEVGTVSSRPGHKLEVHSLSSPQR